MTSLSPPGIRRALTILTASALALTSGCSTVQANLRQPLPAPDVPMHWSAPLPLADRSAALNHWWQAQAEPELAQAIEAAQKVSPTLASAQARLAQASALGIQAKASALPQLSATASVSTTRSPLYNPSLTQAQAGLQIGWVLDLATLRGVESAAAQVSMESAQAQWHDARILVAADVADHFHRLRACRRIVKLREADADSWEESVRLTQLSVRAGMASDSVLASALSATADSRARRQQQQATCDVHVKALVALTARTESALVNDLEPALLRAAASAPLSISAIPAQTLAQRPDVFVAEREVLQAQAQVLQAESARLPRLSLDGFVGPSHVRMNRTASHAPTWTFGPLAVSVPLFDGGQRAAQHHAAQAALQASISAYQGKVRQAVREVEEALVQLRSAELRWREGRVIAEQSRIVLAAQQRLQQQGMVSRLDLLAVQRQAWAADQAVLDLDLERQRAWLTLYRAAGGAFQPTDTPA